MSRALSDIEVLLEDRPGSLSEFGEVLGRAGVSLEGGGVFTYAGVGVAHFLVDDGRAARRALANAGIGPVTVRDVVVLRLDQEVPGQLGLLTGQMARAGVNIDAQYSDHNNNLIIVVPDDQVDRGREVADAWQAQRR